VPRRISLTEPGAFVLGANYWASHAGTRMWDDWRPEVVERDLGLLAEAGLDVLRVFPLWPTFQPIHLLRTGGNAPREFRHGEEPLPDDALGQAGLSAVAVGRFREFADIAERHGLRLIVGLLTGWMSGRMHLPPAVESLNALTDPLAIQWELRFVREFVGALRDHRAIEAWDLGNECNCMAPADREQAYVWTATIANAIRVVDPTRPVVSGMHGLSPTGAWRMQDQGELTDLLTTHPYPVFTPHCDLDPVNTVRTILHSTAESRYYADIGGRPCLCQEIGTLGPMIASEAVAADFIRSCLFSLWANDCHGLVWWCASDQTELAHAPYDWHAVERELGLVRNDGSAKPVLGALTGFRELLDRLPVDRLPLRRREAVCVLSEGQDQWAVALGSFALAKQAGFDLEFQYCDQPIRPAPLYLLPCLSGHAMVSRRRMEELLRQVEAGAELYLSLDTGLPSGFEPLTGLEPQTRERRRGPGVLSLDGLEEGLRVPFSADFRVDLTPTRAEVLGREEDGNPAFATCAYGSGRVHFLSLPLERIVATTPGALHRAEAPAYWRVYRHVARAAMAGRLVAKRHPLLAITEHPGQDGDVTVVAINQSPETMDETLALRTGWRVAAVHRGVVACGARGEAACAIAPNDAAVFVVSEG
jgi:hypothetical protein